jgi:hypothetical protein
MSRRGHWPTAQVPGFSQGAGTGRVVAAASLEAGPSIPFTIAETRRRYEDRNAVVPERFSSLRARKFCRNVAQ